MTETKKSSSLPLLLSITGAVVAVAAGGWFFLYQETTVPDASQDTLIALPATSAVTSTEDMSSKTAKMTTDNPLETDVELRKARLAADADILIFPASQSALYYYGRVLETDPQHAIATAELDAILARVEQTTAQYLAAEEFDDAYEIAMLVAKQRPEHPLVVETQRTLDEYAEKLVAQAIQNTQDGDDDQAVQVLATAESLPGRNQDYFNAVRDSIADIQNVRVDTERDRAQQVRLADDEARAAWVGRIQRTIAEGNLISPAGASARDLLAEHNSWAAERTQLTGEVLSALVNTTQSHIDAQRLNDAEALFNAAVALSGSQDSLQELRASLENALVEVESDRIANLKELVHLKNASPLYPLRAQKRGTSGWVEVYFTVTTSGETAQIEVKQSEPKTVFDRAAIEAIEKWTFEPVEYRGQVINQRAAARLTFLIE